MLCSLEYARDEVFVTASSRPLRPMTRPMTGGARRRRRRRLVLSSLVLTFVLVFGWIGAMVGLQMLSSQNEPSFRSDVRHIFEQFSAGQAAAVYVGASPELHRRIQREHFLAFADDVMRIYGAFQEILSIRVDRRTTSPHGAMVRVRTSIAFTNGRANCSLSFHHVGEDVWLLAAVSLALPTEIGPPELLPQGAIDISDELRAQIEEMFGQIRARRAEDVYDAASSMFHAAIELPAFRELLRTQERILGRFRKIREFVHATQNYGRRRASAEVIVVYSKTETRVRLAFIHEQGQWKLSTFNVAMPRPPIPARTAGR